MRRRFDKWRMRTHYDTSVLWKEAVNRSQKYKDKLQRSRLGTSQSGSASQLDQSAKKRRISVLTNLAAAQARRHNVAVDG